ncbi:protein CUSTOS-like [Gigantopelta aegis]|uniref:protein CUSTOS-like n=1 Tax=Gigantopelta aegis TaxID=1735272 RepID=UPI001B88AF36|nr:protein CUSTOS-like [Gigantopelta aegis]
METLQKSMKKQSSRYPMQEDIGGDNEFEKTDEFQSLVAKTLTDILDQHLELTDRKTSQCQVNGDTNEEGVKLFSSSTCPLRHCEQPFTTPVRKKRTYSTSSNSSEDERLAESAVTQDFIFQDSKIDNSKQTCTTNGLLNKPGQQNHDNDTDVIANKRTKKKKKKKKCIKQVSDDDT